VSGWDERKEEDKGEDASHKGIGFGSTLELAGERVWFGGNGRVLDWVRDLSWQWFPECGWLFRCARQLWRTSGADQEAREHDDVGKDDDRDDHGGKKGEREVRHDGHGVAVDENNSGSGFDDEKDVDQPKDVPREDRFFVFPGARKDEQRDGAESDNDVPPPCREGELAREKAARVEDEKIDSDEADQVRKDEGAKIKIFEAAAKWNCQPIGGEQSSREAKNRDGNGCSGEEGKQLDFADEQGDQEPTCDEQEERPAADRTLFGTLFRAAGHRLEWMMRRR
jgi:hypothetical protein